MLGKFPLPASWKPVNIRAFLRTLHCEQIVEDAMVREKGREDEREQAKSKGARHLCWERVCSQFCSVRVLGIKFAGGECGEDSNPKESDLLKDLKMYPPQGHFSRWQTIMKPETFSSLQREFCFSLHFYLCIFRGEKG